MLGRLQAAAALKTLDGEEEQELLSRAIATWPDVAQLVPLAEAAGRTEDLANERKRHIRRAPSAAIPVEEPTGMSGWIPATAVVCTAVLLFGGLWFWMESPTNGETELASVTPVAEAAPATTPQPVVAENTTTEPAIPAESPAANVPQEPAIPQPTPTVEEIPPSPETAANVGPEPRSEDVVTDARGIVENPLPTEEEVSSNDDDLRG